MEYRLGVNVKREEDSRYTHFFMVDPYAAGSTTENFYAKLKNHMKRVADYFHYCSNYPRLELIENAAEIRWFATVPPGSFLYSDCFGFFETIGFDPARIEEKIVREGDDPVYGFFNNTQKVHIYRSPPAHARTPLNSIFKVIAAGKQTRQRVIIEMGFRKEIHFPLTLEGQRGLSKTEAMHAIAELTDRALKLASLDDKAIQLHMGDDGEIKFESKAIHDCPVTLELTPRFPLDEYLKSPRLKIVFPMNDDRHYSYGTRKIDHDPLFNYYPISVVSISGGEAKHYLEGFGQVALLGHMVHHDNCVTLDGLTLCGGLQAVSVYFVDKNIKRMAFKENVNIYGTFHLEPLLPSRR
jgi:hypothetical protein